MTGAASLWVAMKFRMALFISAFLPLAEIRAVEFAPIFNDGAVLQASLPVTIWGRSGPLTAVTVTFAGQEKTTTSDEEGLWRVQLNPLPPSTESRTLAATSGGRKAVISDVVVGEVWIASGQSNMVWPLDKVEGGPASLTQSLPQIRFVVVPEQTGLPAHPMTANQLKWRSFEPGANSDIAAVAFYFAEYLQKQTGGTIGIIQSSVGGTPAEAWMPFAALENKSALKHHADVIAKGLASGISEERWRREVEDYDSFRKAQREWELTKEGPAPEPVPPPGAGNPWSRTSPTVLYENMITPLVPYTARGVIWYQGEHNAFQPDEYRLLFPALIEAWRQVWERRELPFLFVQLAAYNDPRPGRDFPGLRDAQRFTRDTVPNTGMAVAIDVGERDDIHPKFKQPVGERLARLALAQVYERAMLARGPLMSLAEAKDGTITVTF